MERDEIFQAIKDCIYQIPGCSDEWRRPGAITESTRFVEDLGFDSLDTLELIMEVENEFRLCIHDDDSQKIHTVGAAVDYVMGALGLRNGSPA